MENGLIGSMAYYEYVFFFIFQYFVFLSPPMSPPPLLGTPVAGVVDRKDCYAAMLAPGGHLCVFGTGGEVHCMSRGVNRWETHTYEG